MEFIEIIKQIMIENKLSQDGLAKILGVNQTTVSQWLLGNKKPSFDNIYQIYLKFGIPPNELFDIE